MLALNQFKKIAQYFTAGLSLNRTALAVSKMTYLCTLAVSVFLLIGDVSAQVNAATLHGTVFDSSQAAVSGADVRVQNSDTGAVRSTVSNAAGDYALPSLDPGNYTVTVSKAGFSGSKSTLRLEVGQVVALDFTLRVGQISEVIEISGAEIAIDTTDTTLGSVINQQEVVDLPLNGRQFSQLLELQPGTVPIDNSQNAGKAPAFGSGAVSPSIDGQTNRSNTFFLDGMLASNPFFGGFSFSPSLDDIQEFKAQSHTDQAESGMSTGAEVTVITRPGTNRFHGSVFEFLRNNDFDARNYFAPVRLPYHQNQFGAAFGGPIIKNKLFFFANYEGGRQLQGLPSYSTVPTVAERSGDFSGLAPDGQTPLPTIYNPSTFNPTTFTESPFPGNMLSSVDPGMLALMNGFYPLPNVTPSATTGFNNYLNTQGTIQTGDQGTIRVDYNLSSKDVVTGRYSQNESQNSQQQALANRFVTSFNGKNAGGNWVHTYSSSLLSDVTVAYNSLNIPQAIDLSVSQAALFNSSGVGAGFNEYPGGDVVPLAPAPSLNGGNYTGFWNGAGPIGPMHILQASGSVSKTENRHNLKFGASFYRTWMYTNWSGNSDNFSYQGTWNAACQFASTNATAATQCPGGLSSAGGDPAASMLLSLPNSATRDLGNSGVNLRQNTLGIFAQDSWAINNKLTLNYGLRWDYDSPMTEAHNRLAVYDIYTHTYDVVEGDPDVPSPLPANVAFFNRHSITPPHYDWFSPRLGLAYQLAPKTTLRFGVGHSYDSWGESLQVGQQNRQSWPSAFSQNASATPINVAGITYLPSGSPASGENPFPVPGVLPASPFGAGGLGGQDVKWVPDSSWQWNVEVEQNVGALGTLSLAYVGSSTVHSAIAFPYNDSLPQPTSTTESFPDTVIGVPITDLMSEGNARYNSFQAKLTKAFRNGFTYNASFTWARSRGLDSCNTDTDNDCTQNEYAPTADYGPTYLDIPLVFTFSAAYRLPFGRGRPYLNSGVAGAIVGNWQLNTIILARSGLTVNPQTATNTSNTGGGTQRADVSGDPNSGPKTVAEWWNTAALTVPAAGTFGNAGLNSLRGPHYLDFDISLFRDIPLGERIKLQFRLETFDTFNHPNFSLTTGNGNTEVGNGTFGAINSTFNPGGNRDVQLGLKLLF